MCEETALEPEAVRPDLTAMIGLIRAVSLALRMNSAPFLTPSMYEISTLVRGSSWQAS